MRIDLSRSLLGEAPHLRRLVTYWALTLGLYLLCGFLLWLQVLAGSIPAQQAEWFGFFMACGIGVFYVLVRASHIIKITPAQLALVQGYFATVGVIAGYAIAGPLRGGVLSILLVVLIFCGFALTPRQSVQMCGFAVTLLGLTMLWLVRTQPGEHSSIAEISHFILLTGMMLAALYLTTQSNKLRQRLKNQKTQLADALQRIQRFATTDDLTLLPNRRHMHEMLTSEERRDDRRTRNVCIALLDIDFFKRINDAYGHGTGDIVLASFARHAELALRSEDVLARWGGEEFLLYLPNTTSEAAMSVLKRTQAAIKSLKVPLAGDDFRVTFSAGVTSLGIDEPMDDAIKRADRAMFQAKSSGRNSIFFLSSETDDENLSDISLERDLPNAIRDDHFELYYQPQVDQDGNITSCEALVRWNHPQYGLLGPERFIPIAEQTGLIVPLGNWVLESACKRLAQWSSCPVLSYLSISVNVSAREFRHPNFVDFVLSTVAKAGVPHQRIEFELTESMLIEDIEETIKKMHALKSHGIGFALDDFGTGFSSLSYLKRLPLDRLKIDKSFVQDVVADANDAAIAGTIVALAINLGMTATAEGVETQAQRDFLLKNQCKHFQGYYFSRPVPQAEFEALVRRRVPLSSRQ
jgi:diguanylate cyclase (GGDEF)-like protein